MHVINQLVQQGHRVRTTLRNLEDTNKIEPIKKISQIAKYPIEIVKADLLDAKSWQSAVKDVNYGTFLIIIFYFEIIFTNIS